MANEHPRGYRQPVELFVLGGQTPRHGEHALGQNHGAQLPTQSTPAGRGVTDTVLSPITARAAGIAGEWGDDVCGRHPFPVHVLYDILSTTERTGGIR